MLFIGTISSVICNVRIGACIDIVSEAQRHFIVEVLLFNRHYKKQYIYIKKEQIKYCYSLIIKIINLLYLKPCFDYQRSENEHMVCQLVVKTFKRLTHNPVMLNIDACLKK